MAAHRASCFSSSFHAATAQMRAAPDFPCALPAFLKLLHTVMEPAGLYGCELWGLLSIPGLWSSGWTLATFYSLKDPLEIKRCRLVRQWLQLPQSVPFLPLLHELGSEPHLVHCYVLRAVRFYNCLVELDAASVYRSALQQNIDDALSTRSCAHNFVGALFQVLRILLPREGGLTRTLRACLPFDIDGIDEALHTRYTEHIQRLSQVVNGPGSRIGLYFRVVGTHVLGVVRLLFTHVTCLSVCWYTSYQLPITKWPCQSRAPVGAAPPTRSQLRLQRHTQVPVQAETMAATSPP